MNGVGQGRSTSKVWHEKDHDNNPDEAISNQNHDDDELVIHTNVACNNSFAHLEETRIVLRKTNVDAVQEDNQDNHDLSDNNGVKQHVAKHLFLVG